MTVLACWGRMCRQKGADIAGYVNTTQRITYSGVHLAKSGGLRNNYKNKYFCLSKLPKSDFACLGKGDSQNRRGNTIFVKTVKFFSITELPRQCNSYSILDSERFSPAASSFVWVFRQPRRGTLAAPLIVLWQESVVLTQIQFPVAKIQQNRLSVNTSFANLNIESVAITLGCERRLSNK